MSPQYDPASDSDSDDDYSSYASTSAAPILGYSDGYFTLPAESKALLDLTVSRFGGKPAFPFPRLASPSSSATCLLCSQPIPLLAQIYAPIEGSLNERVLYTFGCYRRSCKGKEGSLRAFRASWRSEPPAPPPPVEKSKKKKKDLGAAIFGGGDDSSSAEEEAPVKSSKGKGKPKRDLAAEELEKLAAHLIATSLSDTDDKNEWEEHPAFPPQYVTTEYEPATPEVKAAGLPEIEEDFSDDEEGGHREGKGAGGRTKKAAAGGGGGGGKEAYEVQKIQGVDATFLKFQERVERSGTQCVRYDHSTRPLLSSGGSRAFELLFPRSTTGGAKQEQDDEDRTFTTAKLGKCEKCKAELVYEYQLMPHLVDVLNSSASKEGSTVKYSAAPKEAQKPGEEDGVEWSTVCVFTCKEECSDDGKEKEGGTWREEKVVIELDSE